MRERPERDVVSYLDWMDRRRLENFREVYDMEGYQGDGDESEAFVDEEVRLPEPGTDDKPGIVRIYDTAGLLIATMDPVTGKRTDCRA